MNNHQGIRRRAVVSIFKSLTNLSCFHVFTIQMQLLLLLFLPIENMLISITCLLMRCKGTHVFIAQPLFL